MVGSLVIRHKPYFQRVANAEVSFVSFVTGVGKQFLIFVVNTLLQKLTARETNNLLRLEIFCLSCGNHAK